MRGKDPLTTTDSTTATIRKERVMDCSSMETSSVSTLERSVATSLGSMAVSSSESGIKQPSSPKLLQTRSNLDKVEEITDQDVLSGRGGGTNLHPGNRYYRELILMHRRVYDRSSKTEKPMVARTIVRMVRERGGKFLRKAKDGSYRDIGDEAAREKTSQALRHRTFEMRSRGEPHERAPKRTSMPGSPPKPTNGPLQQRPTSTSPHHQNEAAAEDNSTASRRSEVLPPSQVLSSEIPSAASLQANKSSAATAAAAAAAPLEYLKALQFRENAMKGVESHLLLNQTHFSRSHTERMEMGLINHNPAVLGSVEQQFQELSAAINSSRLKLHLIDQRHQELEATKREMILQEQAALLHRFPQLLLGTDSAARQELPLSSTSLALPFSAMGAGSSSRLGAPLPTSETLNRILLGSIAIPSFTLQSLSFPQNGPQARTSGSLR